MNRGRAVIGYAGAAVLAAAGLATDNLLLMVAAAFVVALMGAPPRVVPSAAASEADSDNTPRRSARLLWACAIVASLAAAAISRAVPTSPLAGLCWFVTMAALGGATIVEDGIGRGAFRSVVATARSHGIELFAVGFITLFAFGLRVVNLESLPPVIHGDEGEMGVIARDVLAGKAPPLFEASPFFSLPYVLNYLQAGAMLVFGQNVFGLRMLSVLAGTASIPLCYWIARAGWGVVAGLAAAWLFAVGHIYIQYSRLGFVFIESVFMMLAMLAALSLAARAAPGSRKAAPFVAAGLFLGLGQYFYFASRAMPFVLLPLLAHLWRSGRASARQIAALGTAAMVVFAPLALYFLARADVFLDRVGFVSILRDANASHALGRPATVAADWLPLLQVQVARTLGLFVRSGDAGGFYFQSIPAFDALTAALCWLGIGAALARPLRYHEFALIVWFGVGTFLGGVLTIDSPSAQRLTIMLPAVGVLGGVAVARLLQWLDPRESGLPVRWAVAALLAALAVLVGGANADLYFRQYANGTQGREAALVARLANGETPATRLVLFGAPVLFSNHGAIRFVAPGARFLDPRGAGDVALDPADGPVLIFAVPDRLTDVYAVRERWRGGTWKEYTDPIGRLVLVTYRLP